MFSIRIYTIPFMNGAAGFHLDKVLKQNGTDNGIMGAVDKQQLYLTPYGAMSIVTACNGRVAISSIAVNYV
jgi:hypothetical protein